MYIIIIKPNNRLSFNIIFNYYYYYYHLQIDDGGAQALGAQLHDRVRAESVAHLEVGDGGQPDAGVELHLDGRHQNGVVARVHAVEAPEDEAQARVRIEAQNDLTRRIQLAGELDGAAEGGGVGVRELNAGEHARGGDAEVEVAEVVGGGWPVEGGELLLGVVVDVEERGPLARVDDGVGVLRLEQLDQRAGGEDACFFPMQINN